jgi:hypothetical protein
MVVPTFGYAPMVATKALLDFGPFYKDGKTYYCAAYNSKETLTLLNNSRTMIYVCKAIKAVHTLEISASEFRVSEDSSYNPIAGRYVGRMNVFVPSDSTGSENPINIFRDLSEGLFIGNFDTVLRVNTIRLDSSGNVKIDVNGGNIYSHAFDIMPLMNVYAEIGVGGDSVLVGDILIFDAYLSDMECRRVETYLMGKFGIS